ncbi:MAG: hypothetical protein AMS26_05135 [Bacteroides sp. SM23_62]|nr:MAG: hypothetical protein AMS26_05135 [Bacteroides sp. SM23_62]
MNERSRYFMKEVIMLAAIILLCHAISGQKNADQPVIRYPAEEIQVHLTQTFLFPGEILGFKIYCTNPLFPELELSRIAFIELVSDRNTSVLRKKILLEHGAGSGEFLLPDDLNSGIYTVLTYTNWLKNFGEGYFHRARILIINPDQQRVPVADTCDGLQHFRSGHEPFEHPRSVITIMPDKERYGTREKVTLHVKSVSIEGHRSGGLYSVSVCRSEPGFKRKPYEMSGVQQDLHLEEMDYLPDFKGIRLTGKLEDDYGPLQEARIIMSLPGPGTIINSTLTDFEGRFHFLLTPRSGEVDIVFTLPEDNAILKLEEPFWNGLRNPPVQPELCLDNGTAAYLEEKFYHLQLQHKFNQVNFKRGNQLDGGLKDNERFYHHTARNIKIDDYVLLDSLPEYFYELVPSVKFVHSRGHYDIKVLDKVKLSYFEEKPGVFIDGVLYPDYHQISRIPVSEMNSISILPELYFYHDFSFGGIIDLHTKKSDFSAVQLLPNMVRLVYPLAAKQEMEYNAPDHSLPDTLKRIPDFRYLICWEPEIEIGPSGEKTIQFFTGDISGEYTVKVTGISPDGIIMEADTRIFVGQDSETDL